jgi:hypothetical protein
MGRRMGKRPHEQGSSSKKCWRTPCILQCKWYGRTVRNESNCVSQSASTLDTRDIMFLPPPPLVWAKGLGWEVILARRVSSESGKHEYRESRVARGRCLGASVSRSSRVVLRTRFVRASWQGVCGYHPRVYGPRGDGHFANIAPTSNDMGGMGRGGLRHEQVVRRRCRRSSWRR